MSHEEYISFEMFPADKAVEFWQITQTGTWWLRSEIDERWNISGRAEVGGLTRPEESVTAENEFKAVYGQPPEDLQWGYEKD